AVLVGQPAARGAVDFNGADLGRGKAAFEQAADQCVGHVAAADEHHVHRDVHAADLILFLAPKIAVPTRTIVEPSAIAASMSSDMPTESVSKPNSPFSFSYRAFNSR